PRDASPSSRSRPTHRWRKQESELPVPPPGHHFFETASQPATTNRPAGQKRILTDSTCPPDDIGIDPLQGRTQLRLVEVTVVGDPAADAWVVHLGQLGQGFVAAVMKRPAANLAADARQRLRAGGGLETVREDAPVRLHPHDLPGAKLETQK